MPFDLTLTLNTQNTRNLRLSQPHNSAAIKKEFQTNVYNLIEKIVHEHVMNKGTTCEVTYARDGVQWITTITVKIHNMPASCADTIAEHVRETVVNAIPKHNLAEYLVIDPKNGFDVKETPKAPHASNPCLLLAKPDDLVVADHKNDFFGNRENSSFSIAPSR